MVAIIGSPTKCQLRQVACTYHDGVLLVGHIHQNLCALAGLRVLVGDIVNRSIVIDITEVLGYSCGNTDFANGNTQGFHQLQGIVIGTVGGTETRHGDTHDALTVET